MRNTEYIEVNGMEDGINFDGRFKVKGSAGVAYYLLGWEAEQMPMIGIGEICQCEHDQGDHMADASGNCSECDCEEYAATEYQFEDWEETELCRTGDSVIAVMVGDDRRHIVDKSDLTEIDEEDYCSDCGQIGCGWS